MGLVDYISRHPNQKAKNVSAYDEEFIVAKIKLISASVISLNLKSNESDVQFNVIIQAHDPAHQITPKFEATINVINLISTHAKRVHKHDSYLSPASQKHIAKTSDNFSNLKYAYPASQISINTSLAKQNTTQCKQSFENRNELSLATRETQFTNSKFPPIRRHSTNTSRSHHPKTEPVLFALNHFTDQLPILKSNNPLQFKHTLETNYINRNKCSMPSKNVSLEFTRRSTI